MVFYWRCSSFKSTAFVVELEVFEVEVTQGICPLGFFLPIQIFPEKLSWAHEKKSLELL
jgi:hypothetical protein